MADSTYVAPTNGLAGGYTGNNRTVLQVMTAFSAIAWYNAIEIMILVLLGFKRYSGLYFWSLMVTSFSIIVYQIGAWGKMVQISDNLYIMQVLTNVGWLFMVGGQSLVLYSRLHLITQNRVELRRVLWMILINTTVLYIPTTALNFGVVTHPTDVVWQNGYSVMERIQMTLFCVQEFIISGVYVYEASRFLRSIADYDGNARRVLYELLAVNVALILLNVALLSVEYEDLYEIEITLKGMVYAIKLKLELGVLSRLVRLVTDPTGSKSTSLERDGRSGSLAKVTTKTTLPYTLPVSSVPSDDSAGVAQGNPPGPVPAFANPMEFVTTADGPVEMSASQRGPQDRGRLAVPATGTEMASRDSSVGHLYPGRLTG